MTKTFDRIKPAYLLADVTDHSDLVQTQTIIEKPVTAAPNPSIPYTTRYGRSTPSKSFQDKKAFKVDNDHDSDFDGHSDEEMVVKKTPHGRSSQSMSAKKVSFELSGKKTPAAAVLEINVRLWIAQCDHAFTFSGISSDDTKYSALVANLDAETLSYVSDIVLSPPNSDKYHTLSQRLITQFSDSETQKIKKLLTDLQLGDEKPSHLLRKMKELSNGQLQDDFLQSLWLQRMPPHIQTVFVCILEPLDKLAIIANKVSEVVGASSTICAATIVPPPSQSSSCSAQPTMDSLARQIQELSLQVAELTRAQFLSPPTI
ncbi:uncharacterized protein TNCV_2295731 [Trichonephila clavipes]|nr:uncharacterized protein TNCV_2295731 [Trichonephila clavipes]